MRVRAARGKSLELATECGKVDAGHAARYPFLLDALREV
jgi:hypothetical protein